MAKAASLWGTSRRLSDVLYAQASHFEFFQAVRLLLLEAERKGTSHSSHIRAVRFAVEATLTFPASSVVHLEREASHSGTGKHPTPDVPCLTTSFLGLIGPSGVLPDAYTELAIDQHYAGDKSFAAFFDIFHHRLLSLFYRAWEKHHFAIGFEAAQRRSADQQASTHDALTAYLLDFIGMGTAGLTGRLPFRDEALLRYAGLLAQQPRSAEILRALLSDFFDLPVAVEQFLGHWHSLDESEQCELGGEDERAQLGLGAVAGDAVWTRTDRLRTRFGPLTAEQFFRFLPDGDAFRTATALIRWYLGQALDFDLQPVLAAAETPCWCALGEAAHGGPRLGWTAWLSEEPFAEPVDDAIFAEPHTNAATYTQEYAGAFPCH